MSCSLCASVSGMNDASLRLFAAANNIANANVGPPTTVNEVTSESLPQGGVRSYIQSRESVFGVDMVSELTNAMLASHSFAANAKAATIANETLGTVIDMVDSRR